MSESPTDARLEQELQTLTHHGSRANLVEIDAVREAFARLLRERDEARRFGEQAATLYNELLAESKLVSCAFCGKEYPRGTPRHGDGLLTEHIKVCPDHPMRALERERDEARQALLMLRAGEQVIEIDEDGNGPPAMTLLRLFWSNLTQAWWEHRHRGDLYAIQVKRLWLK